MTRLTLSSLACSLGFVLAAGCGNGLDDQLTGVDESEAEGFEITSTLTVPGKAVVYNTGGVGLNLRSGPGTGYGVLVTMPESSEVSVVGGPQNSFYKIQHAGKTGWSHSNYLRPVSAGGGGGDGGQYPGNIHWNAASSSNYTAGRQGSAISRVVIHDMEGRYEGAISWFKNPASQVSAHYCIRSSDGDITQMVREQDIAWHAGNWNYNKSAVGIEHEGWLSQASKWYTDVMYRRSAQLSAAISKRYGFPADRSHFIGHSEVPPPNTHTDPGPGWDWNKYMTLVKSYR